VGKHTGGYRLPDPYYTPRHLTGPAPEPGPGQVCPACLGTTYNPAGLDCMRCAGTGLPDFRVVPSA
jgi:hypothetical protein